MSWRRVIVSGLIVGLLAVLCFSAVQSKGVALAPAVVGAIHDSFNGPAGSDLVSHAADTGQSWGRVPYAARGGIYLSHNWATHGSDPFRSIYLANQLLPADSYVAANLKIIDGAVPSLILRANPTQERYLCAEYSPTRQQWRVFANEGYKGQTALVYEVGAWFETITPGTRRAVRFQVVDDEVSLTIDGVERVHGETYYVASAGFAGIGLMEASGSGGTWLDDFDAGGVSVPTPTPSPTPSPSPSPSPSGGFDLHCVQVNGKWVCTQP